MSKGITLVLGGIGVKGVASIGVLQSLHQHGVKIKKIIAAGISAPVSAQFALGKDPDILTDEFTRFFKENNRALWGLDQLTGLLMTRRRRVIGSFSYFLRERLYCHANLKSDGVISWGLVEPQITKLFGNKTFSDLRIPLAVSAIDIKQGMNVLLNEGKLVDCLKASIAFPGLLPPIIIGNMKLVSSTAYCELPLANLLKSDAPVVTIDLPSAFSGNNTHDMLEIVSTIDEIRSRVIKENLLPKSDYLFRFDGMKQFRWGNYSQIPEIVTQARNETDRLLKTITLP